MHSMYVRCNKKFFNEHASQNVFNNWPYSYMSSWLILQLFCIKAFMIIKTERQYKITPNLTPKDLKKKKKSLLKKNVEKVI